MFIGILISIILVAAIVGCVIAAACCSDNDHPVAQAMSIVMAILLAIAFIIVPFSIHTVDAGEIAVVKRFGKPIDIRTSGIHYDTWFINNYVMYDAKVQNVDIATAAYSSDAQTMDIKMTLQYEIHPDKVMDITTRYGNLAALETRIKSVVEEKTKSVMSSYKAMDIIANRATMSPAVEEVIREAVGEEYYVNIVAVVLTNIDFSDAFEKAVEDKMIAEQNKLKAEYENERVVAQAEANAKTKVLEAEADAQAKVVEAEAEAKANELLENSITDKILRQKYIDKWDGKLPEVMNGDGELGLMIGG